MLRVFVRSFQAPTEPEDICSVSGNFARCAINNAVSDKTDYANQKRRIELCFSQPK